MRRGWTEVRDGKGGPTIRARYWVTGADGEAVARSKSFRVADYATRKAAQAAADRHLAEVLVDTARGTFIAPSEMTVGQLVATYLDGHAESVEASTLRNLRKVARHLPADLSARPVQTVTPLQVRAAFGRLRDGGVGVATRNGLHRLLRTTFARAVDWGVVGASPMRGVSAPEYRPPVKPTWSREQVAAFLDGSAEHRFAALWTLALLTGMRAGELLALRWGDVDLPGSALRVERTATVDAEGRRIVGDGPKTERSRRTVPLPADCVAALERQRDEVRRLRSASATWSIADGDLVFPGRDGRLRDGQTVGSELAAEIRRLGLPPLSLHGMRHSCTSLLMIDGAHPTAVAELIGDTVATLMRVYTHVTVDHRRAAVEALQRSIDAVRSEPTGTTTSERPAG